MRAGREREIGPLVDDDASMGSGTVEASLRQQEQIAGREITLPKLNNVDACSRGSPGECDESIERVCPVGTRRQSMAIGDQTDQITWLHG
jgi:hypothetical protein